MSRIPLPERGQPLDLSYIYTMAQAINDLSEEGSALAQGNNFILQGKDGTLQSSKLYGSQIFAKYITISSLSSLNTGGEVTKQVDFTPGFSAPPVITATIVNAGNTVSGTDVSVVIQNITSSSAQITIKFGSSGLSSVGVNVIAVGLPSKG